MQSLALSSAILTLFLAGNLTGCKKAEIPVEAKSQPQIPAPDTNALSEPVSETDTNATSVVDALVPVSAVEEVAPVPPPPQDTPLSARTLKMQWPTGNRYVYRMDIEQHSTNQISNSPLPEREDIATGVSYILTVLSPEFDQPRQLEVELLAFDTEIRIGDEVVVKFDSAQGASPEASRRAVPQPYRNVVGSKLRLEVDEDGKVTTVVGHDDWVRNVVGDPSGPARQMLVQQFNPGFFQQLADFGRGLPSNSVAPGDSWSHKVELPAGALGSILADSVISLRKWEVREKETFAVIDAKGTLKSRPREDAGGTFAIEGGTVTGTSWFDPDQGALVESVVEQSMRLRSEASGEGANGAVANYVSDLSQKVTVKLIELRKADSR